MDVQLRHPVLDFLSRDGFTIQGERGDTLFTGGDSPPYDKVGPPLWTFQLYLDVTICGTEFDKIMDFVRPSEDLKY